MASSSTAPRRLGIAMYDRVRYVPYPIADEPVMRARGMGYDTGFNVDGALGRPFDRTQVQRELQIIRDDLHCNAVRLIGNDLERLEITAEHAAGLGLEVWFSPYPMQLDSQEMLELLADGAERAERLCSRGAQVVFVAGAELSIFNKGFLPGDSMMARVNGLLNRDPRIVAE